MLNLPDVTLVCLENKKLKEAVSLIAAMMKLVKFGGVHLISQFKNYHEFIQKEFTAHESVYTKFLLTIHLDGYIVHPELWDPKWLEYDYIGAPWPEGMSPHNQRVGNSGFCLRSWSISNRVRGMGFLPINYDIMVCQEYRPKLEKEGFKFAPVEDAAKFSIEHRCFESPEKSFGFHGDWNYPEWGSEKKNVQIGETGLI